MKTIATRIFVPVFFILSPQVLFAQVNNIFDVATLGYQILEKLGYLFWILALVVLFWGLVKFISNAADTKEHESGKHLIVWGLVSFLVLVSLWAIVRFVLVDTFGFTPDTPVCYISSDGNQICSPAGI